MYYRISIFLLLIVFAHSFIFRRDDCNTYLEIDELTLKLTVLSEDKSIFFSEYASFIEKGITVTTKDTSLRFIRKNVTSSYDKVGDFLKLNMYYISIFGTPATFSVYLYGNCKSIVFEQSFENGLIGTSAGDPNTLSTRFPSFVIKDIDENSQLAYAHWVSWYYGSNPENRKLLVAPGFQTPLYGMWNKETVLDGGIGGSGVICIFNKDYRTSAVVSALTNFMAMSHESPRSGSLDYGIMGNVTSLPRRFSSKVLLHLGKGVNTVMEDWGKVVRMFYDKKPSQVSRLTDITLNYLGYTTDNGAYYYYNTLPNKTYEDTLIAVKVYADTMDLPYRYVLLDSWWYYKGDSGGVTNWTAKPDIFPNGLDYLYNATSWYIQAHNRYWDKEATYASENGGIYKFIIDKINNGSVPIDERFWSDLFNDANKWGLRVYEQDWLFNEFYIYVSQMLESVELGNLWLSQMANGAKANDLTIQYCMPYIRHLLQSLEYDVVTQARASDDYVVSPYDGYDNWRIGGQLILLEALGLVGSKDGFWTTKYQPDNPYGSERYEPHSNLHSAVATLSGGPIAIADGIGYTDVNLVMASCRKDGKLLQPTFPARLIDAAFIFNTFGDDAYPNGEIWFASSIIDLQQFGHLLVAELKTSYLLCLQDINLNPSHDYIAYNQMDKSLSVLSDDTSLDLKSCGSDDFSVYTLSPIYKNNWSMLGEVGKWVGVSDSRFLGIDVDVIGLTAHVKGSIGEAISIGFVDPNQNIILVSCSFTSPSLAISSDGSCRVEELDKFISTIFPEDDIKQLYLELLSTGLIGQTKTKIEKFIVANGGGGNGKGVINELALLMFGNYGYALPSNVILNPLETGSNPEVANMKYKRFVIVREPNGTFKITCSTIKELTGGNAVNARLNYSNDTETVLQITLILECNDKPKLDEVNDAIFRRIIDIPFDSTFVDKQVYDKLDDKTNFFSYFNKFYLFH